MTKEAILYYTSVSSTKQVPVKVQWNAYEVSSGTEPTYRWESDSPYASMTGEPGWTPTSENETYTDTYQDTTNPTNEYGWESDPYISDEELLSKYEITKPENVYSSSAPAEIRRTVFTDELGWISNAQNLFDGVSYQNIFTVNGFDYDQDSFLTNFEVDRNSISNVIINDISFRPKSGNPGDIDYVSGNFSFDFQAENREMMDGPKPAHATIYFEHNGEAGAAEIISPTNNKDDWKVNIYNYDDTPEISYTLEATRGEGEIIFRPSFIQSTYPEYEVEWYAVSNNDVTPAEYAWNNEPTKTNGATSYDTPTGTPSSATDTTETDGYYEETTYSWEYDYCDPSSYTPTSAQINSGITSLSAPTMIGNTASYPVTYNEEDPAGNPGVLYCPYSAITNLETFKTAVFARWPRSIIEIGVFKELSGKDLHIAIRNTKETGPVTLQY